jgi:predicted Zn-dependent peptidase
MAFPELRVGSIDGVPAVWAPTATGFATAAIVFRVGQLDESLRERGWTHLIEHLALNHLNHESFSFNGATGWHTTTFHARGTAEEMAGFLQGVTQKLTTLPFDRLEQEAKILETEHCQRGIAPTSIVMLNVYGATGPGVFAYDEFGLKGLDRQRIEDWRAKYFTKSNAYIWFTGPNPLPSFTIPLSVGVGKPLPATAFTPIEKLPMWTATGSQHVSVTALVSDVPALGCALKVLERRMTERLRHQAGLSYSVSAGRATCGTNRDMVFLTADHREGDAEEVQQFMDSELKGMIANPATTAEISSWITSIERFYEYEADAAAASSAAGWAEASLLGACTRSPEQIVSDARLVTPEQVTNCIQELLNNAAWGMPHDSSITDRRIHTPQSTSEWRANGELFLRATELTEYAGSHAMIINDEGVSLAWNNRDQASVRYQELVVGMHQDENLLLIDRSGFSVTITPGMWRDGSRLMSEVASRVPLHLLVGTPTKAEVAPAETGVIKLPKLAIENWANVVGPEPAGYRGVDVGLPPFTETPQKMAKGTKTTTTIRVFVPSSSPKTSPVEVIESDADAITVQVKSLQLANQIRRQALAAVWSVSDVDPKAVHREKTPDVYFNAWSLSAPVQAMLAAGRAMDANTFLHTYRTASTDEQHNAIWTLIDDQGGVERLMRVLDTYGDTSVANTVRGIIAIHLAWEARGSGWGNTVSRENAEKFLNCLRDADRLFDRAIQQDPKHVLPRAMMITTAKGLTVGMKERHKRYADVVALEPDCVCAAATYVQAIAPKWGGDLDDMLAFGRKVLDTYGYGHPMNAITIQTENEALANDGTPDHVWEKIVQATSIRRQMIEALGTVVNTNPTPLTVLALNEVTCASWRFTHEQVLVDRGFTLLKGRLTASPWTNYRNPPTPKTAVPKPFDPVAQAEAQLRQHSGPKQTGRGRSARRRPSTSTSKSKSSSTIGSGVAFVGLIALKLFAANERARGRQ